LGKTGADLLALTDNLLAMAAIGFWSVRQSVTLKNSTPLLSSAAWSSALALHGAA
jgi:hypothetical protein